MSSIFILSSLIKVFHWNEAREQIIMQFFGWHVYADRFQFVQKTLDTLIPLSSAVLMGSISLGLIGGLLILLGVRMRLGAFFLILLILPTTLLDHPFWFEVMKEQYHLQLAMFMKSLSIAGALLLIAVGPKLKKENILLS